MKNKTLKFVKNMLIASVPFIAGGIAGAELSDLVTDNEAIISSVSTASQYVAAFPTFLALHAYDNRDEYKKSGVWNKRMLLTDAFKIMLSLGAAEIPYILGRTRLMDYLLSRDLSPTPAAFAADLMCLPIYFAVVVPLAKKMRII